MNAKRTAHSDETKAAVMAALLTGQSISAVAREYGLPKGTVAGWKNQALRESQAVATPTEQRRERIGALIVDYLEQALETLSAQARTFADESWLRKQDASELAVLHGVLADKTIRILEALAESPHDES